MKACEILIEASGQVAGGHTSGVTSDAMIATLPCIVTTNISGLGRDLPEGVTFHWYSPEKYRNRWSRNARMFLSAMRSDHLVINFDLADVAFFSLLFSFLPRRRCRFTTLDLFGGTPEGLKLRFVRWCLTHVDRLLVYFRDTRPFEELLGVPAAKFSHVPFKINGFEYIRKLSPSEEPYIFSGGRSRRDFKTLFDAVRDLPYRVVLVTCEEAEMNPHGSSMRGLTVPANVEIVLRDSDQPFFLESIAKAKLVVLPLLNNKYTQTGIGVYLQAMALHKCVIVTRGVGVSDVLTDEAATVPPQDPDALRAAVVDLWNNDSARAGYAERGFRYAAPLAGEDRLIRSILAALPGGCL